EAWSVREEAGQDGSGRAIGNNHVRPAAGVGAGDDNGIARLRGWRRRWLAAVVHEGERTVTVPRELAVDRIAVLVHGVAARVLDERTDRDEVLLPHGNGGQADGKRGAVDLRDAGGG